MCDIRNLLLQHDHLLKPQVPLVHLRADWRPNLKCLVARYNFQHFVSPVLEQVERVSQPRGDLWPTGAVSTATLRSAFECREEHRPTVAGRASRIRCCDSRAV